MKIVEKTPASTEEYWLRGPGAEKLKTGKISDDDWVGINSMVRAFHDAGRPLPDWLQLVGEEIPEPE